MAAARKGNTNWFAVWTSVGVVVLLVAIGGAVFWLNSASTSAGPAPDSSAVNAETGAIAIGDGPDTVDTYIDFMCPVCNSFEQAYGPTLEQLSTDGTITLNIHPISILNRASQGTDYSTRAANAAYCVAADDPANVLPFVQAMYAQQPEENTAGLDDETITSIAQQAGAGDGVVSCIADGTYSRFADAMTRGTPVQPGQSSISTPTIAINGTVLANQQDLTGDPQVDIVDRLG